MGKSGSARFSSFVLLFFSFCIVQAYARERPPTEKVEFQNVLDCHNQSSLPYGLNDFGEGSVLKKVTKNVCFKGVILNGSMNVVVSAYRMGPTRFAVISEIPSLEKIHVDSCLWSSPTSNFTARTDVSVLQGGWSIGYKTAIIICDFEQNIGHDSNGGYLYIGVKGFDSKLLVLEEKKNEYSIITRSPSFQLSYCGPPVFGKVDYNVFSDWLNYHEKIVKIDHFNFYDYGSIRFLSTALIPLVPKNKLSIIKMMNPYSYVSWYNHQQTNNNDCLYRMKFNSKWVVYNDLDEFVYVPPQTSLINLLTNLEGYPSFSMGSYLFHKNVCLPNAGVHPHASEHFAPDANNRNQSAFHQMIWRNRRPWCNPYLKKGNQNSFDPDFCPIAYGHRKIIANTNLSHFVHIHMSLTPPDRYSFHFNGSMSSRFPKLLHFQNVLSFPPCINFTTDPKNASRLVKTPVVKDFGLSSLFHSLDLDSKN